MQPKYSLQAKILLGLFAVTIALTCVSLGLFIVEKPYTREVSYEESGLFGLPQYNYGEIKQLSLWHELTINATIISGAAFIIAAAISYVKKKRDEKDVLNPHIPLQ